MDEMHLLDLRLQAEGKEGLLPLLSAAEGAVVGGRFRVQRLLAVGRQSFVFLAATEDGHHVVVKQPAFDYRRPVEHTIASVTQARQTLRREGAILDAAGFSFFPRQIGWFVQDPIVPSAQESNALSSDEAFLVLELLDGESVYQLAVGVWRNESVQARERIVLRIAQDFVRFWKELHAAGWHYCDVSPNNLLIERAEGGLRVLDAGSVVRAKDSVSLSSVTPAYTTPNLYRAYGQREKVPGTLASVLPLLAKILHFALTLKDPLNGCLPDMACSEMQEYSSAAQQAIAVFLSIDENPHRLEEAEAALEVWGRNAPL